MIEGESRTSLVNLGGYMVLMVAVCGMLAACHAASFKPNELTGGRFDNSGCAVTKFNGSFSKYGSHVAPEISEQSAGGNFLPAGSRVFIGRIESSWDFENGNRVRLYVDVPVNGQSRSFFLEKMTSTPAKAEGLEHFLDSMFSPCK